MQILRKYWLHIILAFIVAGGLAFFGIRLVNQMNHQNAESSDEQPDTEIPSVPNEVIEQPAFIDLQSTVDSWLATLPTKANVGLMIYDLDHNQIAASHEPNEVFNTASIYKLFFVYDGYRQIDKALEDGDAFFVHTGDKGDLTVSECLDLMIRESYNGCADPMRADANRFARAEALATELALTNTSSAGLYSTASDLTTLLVQYYRHPDLSENSWQAIQDSMLNQPITTYDWRRGLPTGFTNSAKVYDKVGWNWTGSYWSIYNDATIVEFPEQNRHYVMVVLTENLPSETPLVQLGQQLETTILNS